MYIDFKTADIMDNQISNLSQSEIDLIVKVREAREKMLQGLNEKNIELINRATVQSECRVREITIGVNRVKSLFNELEALNPGAYNLIVNQKNSTIPCYIYDLEAGEELGKSRDISYPIPYVYEEAEIVHTKLGCRIVLDGIFSDRFSIRSIPDVFNNRTYSSAKGIDKKIREYVEIHNNVTERKDKLKTVTAVKLNEFKTQFPEAEVSVTDKSRTGSFSAEITVKFKNGLAVRYDLYSDGSLSSRPAINVPWNAKLNPNDLLTAINSIPCQEQK